VDKPPEKQSLGKGFNFAVTAFCVVLAIFFFLRSNLFAVQTVTVIGNELLTEEQILTLMGSVTNKNIFDIDLRQIRQRLSQVPFIESVMISRFLPSTLYVEITERKPFIAIPTEEGFAIFDKEGHLLSESDINRLSVPLVTGVSLGQAKPGDLIDTEEMSLAILTAESLGPDLSVLISEIMIDNNRVNLITRDLVTVYLGEGTKMTEKLNTLRAMLKQLEGTSKCLKFIDLRFPNHPVTGC
jgi:cell division protein FtsQ